jgi:hypothetical protein
MTAEVLKGEAGEEEVAKLLDISETMNGKTV